MSSACPPGRRREGRQPAGAGAGNAGHTLDHSSYVFDNEKALFAADTLFSIGCGRVFEGTYPMMWESLLKLRALPDDFNLYCGHEYTASNIKFALTIEPDNAALKARAEQVTKLRAANQPTIPVSSTTRSRRTCSCVPTSLRLPPACA